MFKTGNAAGMKISSLHKLTDIRSNRWTKKAKQKEKIATINGSQIVKNLPCRPGLNLLQYIAGQVESSQPELLSVVEDLEILGEVCILYFCIFCISVLSYCCLFVYSQFRIFVFSYFRIFVFLYFLTSRSLERWVKSSSSRSGEG